MARIPKEILLTFYTLNIESGQAKLAKAEYHLCGIKLTNKHDKQRKSFFNPIFFAFYLFIFTHAWTQFLADQPCTHSIFVH